MEKRGHNKQKATQGMSRHEYQWTRTMGKESAEDHIEETRRELQTQSEEWKQVCEKRLYGGRCGGEYEDKELARDIKET